MPRLHIAALGSSFAAGPSIQPIENKSAARSSRNYAHQLAERLDADLTDLTVSGATLLNVLNERQSTLFQTFEPQLELLAADADIVTLTCGGNDINYIGSLVLDSLTSYLGPVKSWAPTLMSAPSLDLRQLTDRFLAVLDKIHDIAPQAKVYLVEYIAIIGTKTQTWVHTGLTAEQNRHYEEVASLLSQAYQDAAKARTWAELVPVAELSRAHGVGSDEPWVEGFSLSMLWRGQAPYHPNLAGHTAVADILYRQIAAERPT